jgi:hypothetical protein
VVFSLATKSVAIYLWSLVKTPTTAKRHTCAKGAKFAIANGHWFFIALENDTAYWSVGFSVKAAQM